MKYKERQNYKSNLNQQLNVHLKINEIINHVNCVIYFIFRLIIIEINISKKIMFFKKKVFVQKS